MTVRRLLSEQLLDAQAAQPFLHDIMPVGAGEQPSEVRAWRDVAFRLRRVRAIYPNGWVLQFNISERGVIGRIRASCRLVTRPRSFTP